MKPTASNQLQQMAECAVFSALLCIVSPLALYIGTIPISLGSFAVLLTGLLLGVKRGFVSVLVFILIGLCGLPVFAGFQSGPVALPGPTGGYIWSYLPMVAVVGLLTGRLSDKHALAAAQCLSACITGLLICYACGTLQFSLLAGVSYTAALSVCVLPFVVIDLCKAVAATLLALCLRPLLQRAGLLRAHRRS